MNRPGLVAATTPVWPEGATAVEYEVHYEGAVYSTYNSALVGQIIKDVVQPGHTCHVSLRIHF